MTTCLLSVALYVSIPLLTLRCCRTLISLLLVGSACAQNWGSWKACGFVNAHQNQQWPVLLKWSSWLINQLLITWVFFFPFFLKVPLLPMKNGLVCSARLDHVLSRHVCLVQGHDVYASLQRVHPFVMELPTSRLEIKQIFRSCVS